MALELRQSLKSTQQLVMPPQLQQAIKLLQLSRLELQQAVREELEVNPALEETAEGTAEEEGPAPAAGLSASPGPGGRPYYENTLTRRPGLAEHLDTQLRLLDISDTEGGIAQYLVGNIDENGYLKTTAAEAAGGLSLPAEDGGGGT